LIFFIFNLDASALILCCGEYMTNVASFTSFLH
jgi:hypothetical protein